MSSTKKRMGGLGSLSSFSTTVVPKPEPTQPPEPTPAPPVPETATPEPEPEAIAPPPEVTAPEPEARAVESEATLPLSPASSKAKAGADSTRVKQKTTPKTETTKLVTVNIKIAKTQQQWLAETATQVRDNNEEPVPPSERVYPQHLIGIAIDLLRATNVDWTNIRNTEDLRKVLDL